jgi:hypothetical protein
MNIVMHAYIKQSYITSQYAKIFSGDQPYQCREDFRAFILREGSKFHSNNTRFGVP